MRPVEMITKTQIASLLLVLGCFQSSAIFCSTVFAQIVHPGVAHSAEQIEFVKAKIAASEQPWLGAWKGLKQSRYASLDYQPQPFKGVQRGPYNDPDIGSSEFSDDARAAYYTPCVGRSPTTRLMLKRPPRS